METGDFIAIGILLFCVILGILGQFKWLLQIITGMVVGLLVLGGISLLAENPKIDWLSRGVFKQGVILPYIRSQVNTVEKLVSEAYEIPEPERTVTTGQCGEDTLTAKAINPYFSKLTAR